MNRTIQGWRVRVGCWAAVAGAVLAGAAGGGCAGNSAAAGLGAAAAVGIGVPLATRSHVEVSVDVYNHSGSAQFTDAASAMQLEVEACARRQVIKEKGAGWTVEVAGETRPDPLPEGVAAEFVRLADELRKDKDLAARRAAAPLDAAAKAVRTYNYNRTSVGNRPRELWAERARALDLIREANQARSEPAVVAAVAKAVAAGNQALMATEANNPLPTSINTTVNVGPLATEVTQLLLTKGFEIDTITRKENQGHWRPFAHAMSEGGTGNHDAVIYFENMGWPVLKSSRFNPSKFIEAFGKTYQMAFGAMARAYGVPVPGGDAKGNGVAGLDAYTQGERRKAAVAKAEASRKQLLGALEKVIGVYENKDRDLKTKAGVADKNLTDDEVKAIKAELEALSVTLRNPGATP